MLYASKIAKLVGIDPGQPFVFSSLDRAPAPIPPPPTSGTLATPFKRFSIEVDDGFVTSENAKTGAIHTTCIVVDELAPGDYKFIISVEIDGETAIIKVTKDMAQSETYEDSEVLRHNGPRIYNDYIGIVNAFLERLHAESSGTVSANDRVKLKKRKGMKAKFYRPRTAIYISPERGANKPKTFNSKPINWRHTWSVRGHWRRLKNPDSIGLDRENSRTVKGFTWIGDYKKGQGPEIKKVRLVR